MRWFIYFCVLSDLLHLSPKSADAKIFEGLGNSTKTNTSTPVSSGKCYRL
jgi:hypothetical protein